MIDEKTKIDCVGAAVRNLFEKTDLDDWGFVLVIVPLQNHSDYGSMYSNIDEPEKALEDVIEHCRNNPAEILPDTPEETQH